MQVNAIQILESEVADVLSVRKDHKSGDLCYENQSPFWGNITQRKKWASSSYLNCQTTAVNFETYTCSNRFSQWTTDPGSPGGEMNRQEASTFFWLSDPQCDSNNNTSLLEAAILSGCVSEEITCNKERSFNTNEQDRSVTTLSKNQNKINDGADKDIASPLRSVKCVFMEQEVQDTVGIHPIKDSDNNSKRLSQNLITLRSSSKLALVSPMFPMEMDSLGENSILTNIGPPEDQLYQVSDRIRKCKQTYLGNKVCSKRQEKDPIPPSGKRRKTFSEKRIKGENQHGNSSCDVTCKSSRSGAKQLSQKNKVTDKKMFSNEINKEIKQIRKRLSADLHNTKSKINNYKEIKESEKIMINVDQQIPNTLRTLSMKVVQKMTHRSLKQEGRRIYDTKASDFRKLNLIPLESNLKPDSQEYMPKYKTKERQVKCSKIHPKKASSLNTKMEVFNSDSKQSNIGDSLGRKKQGLKSHIGNSRIPILASYSVKPGLNNMCHASVKSKKDIQNNVNKKQIPSTVQISATRDGTGSMTKAKQIVENGLSTKDQSDFGKKVVSETVSGEHESTKVVQVIQNEVHNRLSKTGKNFSQKTTKKLVPNSPRSLEISYVTLTQEQPVRTSLVDFQVLEPHLINGRILTTPPPGLENCQITKGRNFPSGPNDSWSMAVLPRDSSLSEKTPKKENQESYNLENTSFSSPIPTSKFLKESRTTLRRSSRNKENLVSYREPRLNCKLRRGDPFIDAVSLHSPINRKEEIMKNSKNTK
ncbi:uncharacterized protein LOC127553162 isoform X1 [Antechinus flavipes]|uniref:uncharacterized protein LOC127553162 isoform X1 n=1 Tax=Antechinus flavipes TaxID=38775 RepID=UPI0022366469|nr:uncharacterized protein LOC127553162 isoform X1 [Antechinus flavipes]